MTNNNDILNQFAVISDLLEKINIKSFNKKIHLDLNEDDFNKVFDIIQEKYGRRDNKPKNKFTLTIGVVDIIFNKNNV